MKKIVENFEVNDFPVDSMQLLVIQHQLVETTVRRGLMQHELVNKKIHEQTANPSTSSNTNHKTSDVQSDIHFQAVMGDQFKQYDTPEKKVKAFNLIYSPFSMVM